MEIILRSEYRLTVHAILSVCARVYIVHLLFLLGGKKTFFKSSYNEMSVFPSVIIKAYDWFYLETNVKWPNSSISNNSFAHKSAKLNGSRYWYVSLTI